MLGTDERFETGSASPKVDPQRTGPDRPLRGVSYLRRGRVPIVDESAVRSAEPLRRSCREVAAEAAASRGTTRSTIVGRLATDHARLICQLVD